MSTKASKSSFFDIRSSVEDDKFKESLIELKPKKPDYGQFMKLQGLQTEMLVFEFYPDGSYSRRTMRRRALLLESHVPALEAAKLEKERKWLKEKLCREEDTPPFSPVSRPVADIGFKLDFSTDMGHLEVKHETDQKDEAGTDNDLLLQNPLKRSASANVPLKSPSASAKSTETDQKDEAGTDNDQFALTRREKLQALSRCINTRDMRKVDDTFLTSSEPSLLVRKHGILFNGWQLRAIILHDKMFLMAPTGADGMLTPIMERLRWQGMGAPKINEARRSELKTEKTTGEHFEPLDVPLDTPLPFEFRALEAMLLTTVTSLENELHYLEKQSNLCAENLRKRVTQNALEVLRRTRNNVEEFEIVVEGVRHALAELLMSDEDMRHMYLSEIFENPSIFGDKRTFAQHDEMELLLESYLEHVEGVLKFAKICSKQAENTKETVELRLAITRNVVMKIEVLISSVTMTFAFGALIAGIFGMNLSSGVEDADNWFWSAVAGIFTMGFILFGLFIGYFRKYDILSINS